MSINSQNVLDYPNNNTIFMVWNFKNGMAIKETFQNLCALISNLNNSARTRFQNDRASVVLGIGFEAWHLLNLPSPLPKEFEMFTPIAGTKHTAVATRGDLHLHIRSDAYSYCVDAASAITDVLRNVAENVQEVHGFRYWDSRSILGFVDGTENPHGEDREYFGLIGNEDPVYKGGSYLFVQKYLHDLQAWKTLPVAEQEK